jgi:hypothetical protein
MEGKLPAKRKFAGQSVRGNSRLGIHIWKKSIRELDYILQLRDLDILGYI